MIGSLVHSDDEKAKSEFRVEAGNIFLENGRLTEPALVENIAQTAAARAGWEAVSQNKPVAIGYIGAIQNLEFFDLPAEGDLLTTTIVVKQQVFDVTLIAGELSCNGRLMASCEMKIFIRKES